MYRFVRWTLIWVVLPLVVVYAVLWIWHPEDALLRRQFAKFEQENGVRIAYDKITVTPAFGLQFSQFSIEQLEQELERKDGTRMVIPGRRFFTAELFSFRVAFRPFLRGKAGILVNGNAYGGEFSVDIALSLRDLNAPMELNPVWRNIDLEKLRMDHPDMDHYRGRADGHAELVWDSVSGDAPKGPVHITMQDVSYMLPERVSGALALSMISQIDGDFVLEGPAIRITSLWLRGDTGSIYIDGTVYRDYHPENSVLDLKARIHGHAAGEEPTPDQYIPVTIRGTAGSPQIEFMGIPMDQLLHGGGMF